MSAYSPAVAMGADASIASTAARSAQLEEHGVADPVPTVIGEERTAGDHALVVAALGEILALSLLE